MLANSFSGSWISTEVALIWYLNIVEPAHKVSRLRLHFVGMRAFVLPIAARWVLRWPRRLQNSTRPLWVCGTADDGAPFWGTVLAVTMAMRQKSNTKKRRRRRPLGVSYARCARRNWRSVRGDWWISLGADLDCPTVFDHHHLTLAHLQSYTRVFGSQLAVDTKLGTLKARCSEVRRSLWGCRVTLMKHG